MSPSILRPPSRCVSAPPAQPIAGGPPGQAGVRNEKREVRNGWGEPAPQPAVTFSLLVSRFSLPLGHPALGQARGSLAVVRRQRAVDDELAQEVFQRPDPGTRRLPEKLHQVITV